jgi:hypothetical protein
MELVRGPQKRRNFTILDNPVINDDRLPFRAPGVLAFLLSKPEGWRVDATLLSLGEGREGPYYGHYVRLRVFHLGWVLRQNKGTTL